jgi:hypothetical protein
MEHDLHAGDWVALVVEHGAADRLRDDLADVEVGSEAGSPSLPSLLTVCSLLPTAAQAPGGLTRTT